MSDDNVQVIKQAFDDFNSGNVEGVLDGMTEDVQWTEPGGGDAPSGTFTGPQAVAAEVFSAVPGQFDEFSVEPDEITGDGDKVTAKGRFKGKAKSGDELDVPFVFEYVMEDGKVKSFEHVAQGDAWANAWS